MRKMSRGMSQRKLPGGHSASDSNVTPGHQPPAWGVQGGSRQGQRGKAGPQLFEGWSSPVNLGNGFLGAHNEKCCSGRTIPPLCSHPATPRGSSAPRISPRPCRQWEGTEL